MAILFDPFLRYLFLSYFHGFRSRPIYVFAFMPCLCWNLIRGIYVTASNEI